MKSNAMVAMIGASAMALGAPRAGAQVVVTASNCNGAGPMTSPYLHCLAERAHAPVSSVARTDLPRQALRITTNAVTVRIIGGAMDSVSWFVTPILWQFGFASASDTGIYRAAAGADAFEIRLTPDSLPTHRLAELFVAVPSNLQTLQIDSRSGSISVENFSGQLTITVGKGSIGVAQIAGPVLIENRDGPVRASLIAVRHGQESTLRAPLNILARNGDIDLTFPAAIKATLDAEAHQGSIVDAPLALSLWQGSGDTVEVKTQPVLALQDNELRNVHRDFNGGGPRIKLATLNGNVTLVETIPKVVKQ